MNLEEELELVKEVEARVLDKRRHEPFQLAVETEDEAVLLQNLLNKAKVDLFQEMADELERHIIECPGCWRSVSVPVHKKMYKLFDTGEQMEENVFNGEIEFKCESCMKTVRGESVVALLDRITEKDSKVREYVLEKRAESAEPRFVGDLTEEDIERYQEQGQYAKLFPHGVSDLGEWYDHFE